MNSLPSSPPPGPSQRIRFRCWILWTPLAAALILLTCTLGCRYSEVQYARATKLHAELTGYMRLAQDTVMVNVIGKDQVGKFKDETTGEERDVLILRDGKLEKSRVSGVSSYIVLHEQDVRKFVQNTQQLKRLMADKEIAALAERKGLMAQGD